MPSDEKDIKMPPQNDREDQLFVEEVRNSIKQEIYEDRQHALKGASLFPGVIAFVPETVRTFLLSFERTIFYDFIAKKLAFSQEQRRKIGMVVWRCVLEKKWESLAMELEKQVRLSGDIARSIAETLYADFASFAKKVPSSESVAQPYEAPASKNILSLSLVKALEKYPRILHERITDADIVFRGSDGPVVPSIKNWITAYHQEAGSGAHSAFERSEFLFHNENAKKLSAADRNVLSCVLESLDEGKELPINADAQTVDILAMRENGNAQSNGGRVAVEREASERRAETTTAKTSIERERSETSTNRQSVVPPAQRSEAALYARERVEDRKDVWRAANTPGQTEKTIYASTTSSLSPKPTVRESARPVPENAPLQTATRTPLSSRPAVPEKGTFSIASQDYTDYYPIPQETKTPISSTVSRISFSSPHTFSTEKKEGLGDGAVKEDVAATSSAAALPTPSVSTAQPQKKRLIIG